MPVPPMSAELRKRILLTRRDVGDLLFHFVRRVGDTLEYELPGGPEVRSDGSASSVLWKIPREGALRGTGDWSGGQPCICFSEAPITEMRALFALVSMAAAADERPRYEPYGVAVPKDWLFGQGGRPVIYDHPDAENTLPESQRYKFVPYDPLNGPDVSWEREWRVKADHLILDPKKTLVVVPTADEAFELAYAFADEEPEYDALGSSGHGEVVGSYHTPSWLTVSLDIFGFDVRQWRAQYDDETLGGDVDQKPNIG